MKSHIFDTENTFHTFLLLIPKGSMIRLNIWNMYPMINPRKQHKAALDGGAHAGGSEWIIWNLSRSSKWSPQNQIKAEPNRVSAEQFWQKIGPFCGMIGWQPTILCNFLKYELELSERESGWAALRICPHPGRDAIKLIRWLQTKRDIFLRWNDSLKFCCDSSLHWQRLMANLAQNIPEISAR